MLGVIGLVVGCVAPQGELAPTGAGATQGGAETVAQEDVLAGARPRPRGEALGEGEREDGDALFGSAVNHFALSLSEAAMASLRTDPRSEVEADLAWRGRTYRVGARLKGNGSFRTVDEKPSLKLDVHAFDPDAELDGAERLTLNNLIQDPTMLREHTAYALYARAGLPAPRFGYARLTVNGAEYGLYGVVESMDEELLRRVLPDDAEGNLYDASGCDFTYARDWFDLEESGGAVPLGDIDALVAAVEAAPPGEIDGVLSTFFDRDALIRFLAVDTVAGHSDGYVFNHNNYLAYHGLGGWRLLPWGADQMFRKALPPRGDDGAPIEGRLAQACWADPDCAADLTGWIEAFSWMLDDAFVAEIEDTAARIRAYAEDDPRAEFDWDPDALVEFVEARGAFVRDAL